MKLEKYVYLLMILLVCMISISAVSAADDAINDIDSTSVDDSISDIISTDTNDADDSKNTNLEETDEQELNTAEEEQKLSESTPKNFTDLNNTINGNNNDTIDLYDNYTYSEEDNFRNGIEINRNITINGHGITIDASGKGRIFVTGYSNNVTFNNIIFKNAYTDGNGGAITTGTAYNCTFINNTAYSSGAMNRGTAYNCTFINNTATYGGAIGCTAYNCTFAQNTADYGGAIYDGDPYNCTFLMPKDDDLRHSEPKDCRFINPNLTASDFMSSNGSGEKLSFNVTYEGENFDWVITNITIYQDGEEIDSFYAYSGEGWVVNLTPGTYKAKLSLEDERVQDVEANIIITDGTTFWDLNRDINGNDESEITLNHSYKYNPDFDSNFRDGIYLNRNITIDGKNNTIDANGKARIFYMYSVYDTAFKNINFINGYSSNSGGAINTDRDCYLENCNFIGNIGYGGGAIYCQWTLTVVNCNFTNNSKADSGTGDGGAIHCQHAIIKDSNFIGNKAYHGGSIYAGWSCTVENSNFSNNNDTYGYGGAIYTTNCSAVNSSFTNNYGEIGGGIYTNKNCSVSNCTFINNKARYYGGAVWAYESAEINNSVFINNNAPEGSALGLRASSQVHNNTFINNTGKNTIYNYKTIDDRFDIESAINNNIFLNNENEKIFLTKDATLNADYNWFGNNASNYTDKPDDLCNNWLFLNGTANPNPLKINENSDICFKLYLYDGTEIRDHDNDLLPNINLTLSSTGGNLEKLTAGLGETITFNSDAIGKYDISANIENAEASITLDIKYDPNLSIDPQEVIFNKTTEINLNYNASATGTVNITLTGKNKNYTFTELELNAVIPLGEVDCDEYEVNITYSGDESFLSANATGTLTVQKNETKITPAAETIDIYVGDKTTIKYTLNPSDAVGDIIFTSNDTSIVVVDSSTGEIKALKEGSAIITISFSGSTNYNASNATVKVVVSKKDTEITAPTVTTTYNVAKNLIISIKDSQGKDLSGVKVTVNLGKKKTYTTDKKGQVKIAIGKLVPKTYTAKISFEGNDLYKASSASAKVTVKKATPKISAKAKTFKYETKVKKYKITLKDNKGKALKNKKVTLKVKGKTYTAKTNSKGIATFNLKKLTKKGKYTAAVKYAGDKYYKKATKKAKIKVKAPAWKTIGYGSKNKSMVKKIQRALKNNGYYLSYKGRYLKIDGIYHKYTRRAVKQFQTAKKLKATGKVDYKTAKKLKIVS